MSGKISIRYNFKPSLIDILRVKKFLWWIINTLNHEKQSLCFEHELEKKLKDRKASLADVRRL